MKPVFSFYTASDFERVYSFLKSSAERAYLAYEQVRFQFCFALHAPFKDHGGGFERTCGLWRIQNEIVAMVLTEGNTEDGETFFVFRSESDKTDELISRMCAFAERFTSAIAENRKSNSYKLCVAEEDAVLSAFLLRRGYKKTEKRERVMVKEYPAEPESVVLSEGFTIEDARTVSPFFSALAHNHSFRYSQDNEGCEQGFARIRQMPDYRPELDLVLFDPEGQPAGLVTFWVTEGSSVASLEPLGTVWWYRRMGLGKALITEGINRTRALGCTHTIGGDQPFYWDLGFEPKQVYSFWEWMS